MEPVLAGPTLNGNVEAEGRLDGPVIPLALVNDYHYWGVLSSKEPDIEPVDKGEVFVLGTVVSSPQKRRSIAQEEKGDDQDPRAMFYNMEDPDEDLPEGELAMELALCQCLRTWIPWATPSKDMLEAMQNLADAKAISCAKARVGVVDRAFTRAEAIAALEYEDAHFQLLPEMLKYQHGARRALQTPKGHRRKAMASRCLAVKQFQAASRAIPTIEALAESLEKPCVEGHACLLALSPYEVRNWRTLWWSMPRHTRSEVLLAFFRDSLEAHRREHGRKAKWNMTYAFLGIKVCRAAFIRLTSIGCSTIQKARNGALQGQMSVMSQAEMACCEAISTRRNPTAYMHARQWLEHYASTRAELSPQKLEAYLPSGRKIFYYWQYHVEVTADRAAYRSGETVIASAKVFLQAWREELPWLIVCKSVCMFVKCNLCEYLKRHIDQMPRDREERYQK